MHIPYENSYPDGPFLCQKDKSDIARPPVLNSLVRWRTTITMRDPTKAHCSAAKITFSVPQSV